MDAGRRHEPGQALEQFERLISSIVAASVGDFFTSGSWYEQLAKPSWTPPDWLFGPVWTVLYTLMAVDAWLVWKDNGFRSAPVALGAYVLQLVLNVLGSALFFGLELPGLRLSRSGWRSW